jgi:hypothetical protein
VVIALDEIVGNHHQHAAEAPVATANELATSSKTRPRSSLNSKSLLIIEAYKKPPRLNSESLLSSTPLLIIH